MNAEEVINRLHERALEWGKKPWEHNWSPEVWIETVDGYERIANVVLDKGGIYILTGRAQLAREQPTHLVIVDGQIVEGRGKAK